MEIGPKRSPNLPLTTLRKRSSQDMTKEKIQRLLRKGSFKCSLCCLTLNHFQSREGLPRRGTDTALYRGSKYIGLTFLFRVPLIMYMPRLLRTAFKIAFQRILGVGCRIAPRSTNQTALPLPCLLEFLTVLQGTSKGVCIAYLWVPEITIDGTKMSDHASQ